MSDPMLKLYDRAPPKVLGALAAGAILRSDGAELECIMSAVPRKKYLAPHVDYLARKDALVSIAFLWGMMYWQTIATKRLLSASILAEPDMPTETMVRYDRAAAIHNSTLKSLDAALDAFAGETGLDASAVRKWAGAYPPDGEPLTAEQRESADAYVAAWLEVVQQ